MAVGGWFFCSIPPLVGFFLFFLSSCCFSLSCRHIPTLLGTRRFRSGRSLNGSIVPIALVYRFPEDVFCNPLESYGGSISLASRCLGKHFCFPLLLLVLRVFFLVLSLLLPFFPPLFLHLHLHFQLACHVGFEDTPHNRALGDTGVYHQRPVMAQTPQAGPIQGLAPNEALPSVGSYGGARCADGQRTRGGTVW